MSTIVKQSELVRRAVEWIDEQQKEGRDIGRLLDEAAMRFNLGPKDMEFLEKFFKKDGN
ncbi:MAG: hypothetical protein ACOC0U_01610 [Desulfovibrionales bacterium]